MGSTLQRCAPVGWQISERSFGARAVGAGYGTVSKADAMATLNAAPRHTG